MFLKNYSISDFNFEIIKTKKEFDGFYTVVLFPLIPRIKKKVAKKFRMKLLISSILKNLLSVHIM